MTRPRRALLVLGNQLFPIEELSRCTGLPVFMSEDHGLCTYTRHHQQKLVLFLAAMREYADELDRHGFTVTHHRLDQIDERPYESRLEMFCDEHGVEELLHFEIEDHFFARRIDTFCEERKIDQSVLESPMFLTSRPQFEQHLDGGKRPFMARFYQEQRKRLSVLLTEEGKPQGGKWSFDADNRRRLPKDVSPPELPSARRTHHVEAVIQLVAERFGDHPGQAAQFWWPVTRQDSLVWLDDFVEQRLERFGDFQDAIAQRSETAFHSVLTPMLNLGLITPRDVLRKVLEHAERTQVPLNSVEGMVRQVIGWREFIRGIYQHYDDQQQRSNHWQHHRRLGPAWWDGSTGIPPLDDAIKTALRLGWTHHINRLMVVGNLMNLCEIEPREVHDWFMDTHVDSSDWVMGPNVYGMALFSDGGIFATKPYICGSNYLLKMSDFKRGGWCDVVDGLYWRFVEKHRDFFASQHRLSMTVRTLDRMKSERRSTIFSAAEKFLEAHTKPE